MNTFNLKNTLDDKPIIIKNGKTKKKITMWGNIYKNTDMVVLHKTKQLADNGALPGRIACTKVTYEYEE